MGLLDDLDYQQAYAGLLGPLLYRGPQPNESDLAQQARAAAAAQLARGVKGGNRTFEGDVFRTGSAPFGFAGPGSWNPGATTGVPDLSAFEPARPDPEEQGPMPDDAMMAQLGRNAAAARLARGTRSVSRTNASPDFGDVAKSAGIGVANGAVGLAGLPANTWKGFGFLPDKFFTNGARRAFGAPELGADAPDWADSWTPEALQGRIEDTLGSKFYQPQTRLGRYAETVGELAPLSLGGAAFGALRGGFAAARGTMAADELGPAAKAGLDNLGRELTIGAVAPGVIIEGLREAAPGTKLDSIVRYGYPTVRRGLPLALAAKRHLGL